MGGGQVLTNLAMPSPNDTSGVAVRLSGAAQSLVYVPGVDVFAASSGGDGGGVIGGRTPDGLPLAAPFPIALGSAGGLLAASDNGDLFIAWQNAGAYEVRMFRPGVERSTKGVLRHPRRRPGVRDRSLGEVRRGGDGSGHVPLPGERRRSDQEHHEAHHGRARRRVRARRDAVPARRAARGRGRWRGRHALDDRRSSTAAASRSGCAPIVLDGTDRVIAFDPKTGVIDELAAVGQIQDLVVSRDGRWVGLVAEAKRAVLFRLP